MHEYRRNELRNCLVLLAEHRAKRPHLKKGTRECPFCRGREAMVPPATLELPKGRWRVRAFPNKFPFVERRGRFAWRNGRAPAFGDHEVIVETHEDKALFENYSREQLNYLWSAYLDRFNDFSSRKQVEFVLLLKNHGSKSGASIPHEHSQIVSYPFVPEQLKGFLKKPCALCDHEKIGLTVFSTKNFRAITPFNALTACELWLVPKKHVSSMLEVDGAELLEAIQECVRRLKRFDDSYNFIFVNSPRRGNLHFHVEFFTRKAVWGAVELGLGIYLNQTSPESAKKLLG
ncbi:hypothetical protein COX85_04130 [Candidatus Micrarchaeota archaeon CG_4_10_14_0_2_um_filter_55_9]|nr:MAG: hypothetical protein AUJ15_02400 [Candidatus Micrarchaeota archaeon CG1_02_55_41]PIO03218.1 MAG: hypothetical protein COT57_00805 [Candidatus Micrarchaeota archaeon CG09_land_8_20_14_0_10_55_25]PIZ91400.1 MAG: hypothetical protein COX85_04130 [Candidatus Micrarchaeota archaeon CG_4_10_14_0_2_um_filter_55_9]PJD00858.1 MAG: hypothetical protein COU38_04130 [Candidatus Micrarchaeota archaeon CG10_big_fil_rev_8_21_14_0_10_54_18]